MSEEYEAKVAQTVVDRLFTNGMGQQARRLVLELDIVHDGGGWCREAVRDQVLAALAAVAAEKEKG